MTRPASPGDLYDLVDLAHPQVSPDGSQWITLVTRSVRDVDARQTTLWIGATGRSAEQLTDETSSGSPRWRPNGRAIVMTVDRGGLARLAIVDLGGDVRVVGPEDVYVLSSEWSPSGDSIAFVGVTLESQPAGPRVVTSTGGRLDGAGWLEDFSSHVYVVDVASGICRQLTAGTCHDDDICWSPNGERIVFTSDRNHTTTPDRPKLFCRDLYDVPMAGGQIRQLSSGWTAILPVFAPDGTTIAFAGVAPGNEVFTSTIRLFTVDADGSSVPTRLHEDLNGPILGFPGNVGYTYRWLPDSSSLLFVAEDRGRSRLYRVSLDSTKPECLTPELDMRLRAFDLASDAQVVAVGTWLDRLPELLRIDLTGQVAVETSFHEQLLGELHPVEWTSWIVRASDETASEVFVVEPPPGVDHVGTVLELHGGPHAAHPPAGPFGWLFAATLAGAGFRVLLPNPRGSTGYGQAFLEAAVGDWGGGDLDDVFAAARRSVAEDGDSQAPTFIGGYSYGGYLAAWAVTQSASFAAATIGAPMTNLASWSATTDFSTFKAAKLSRIDGEVARIDSSRSPVLFAENVTAPVLLFHNEGDRRCPIQQSEELFHALATRGATVVFVRYPGDGHDASSPSQLVDRLGRIRDWYLEHQ